MLATASLSIAGFADEDLLLAAPVSEWLARYAASKLAASKLLVVFLGSDVMHRDIQLES